MKISKSIQINAPANTVWHVMAHEFENVSQWSSSVTHSEKTIGRNILDGADVSGRVCKSPYGDQTEAFTHFDEAGKTFTYEPEGQTFLVSRASNTWQVESTGTGNGACLVNMNLELDLLPIVAPIMYVPMWIFLRKVLNENLEELKYYTETGKVHPRKAQSIAKTIRKTTVKQS